MRIQRLLLVFVFALPLVGCSTAGRPQVRQPSARELARCRAQEITEVALASGAVYRSCDVDTPAVALPGNPVPQFPSGYRAEGTTAETLVGFVVDSTGRAEPASIVLLRPSQPAFDQAVLTVLPRYRFRPAVRQGERVRMWVEMPFRFVCCG